MAVGALLLLWFFVHIRAMERKGEEPLLSTSLFHNRTSNLGLVTQNIQWLILIGTSFVVATYLQVVRGYNAIETGVIFTAATVGILVSSLAAERFAKRRSQRTLIVAGFIVTLCGIALLLAMVKGSPSAWAFAPGLLFIGLGVGVMLTPSVNVVQSSFPGRAAGGDIRPVPQRVQPGLVTRHGSRRHHPRRRARRLGVRPRDDRAGCRWGHRTGSRLAPPDEPRPGRTCRRCADVTSATAIPVEPGPARG